MSQTIHNFEQHISRKILDRGASYFEENTVQNLAQEGKNWAADVYGTDDYLVEITIENNGKIIDWSCDCPYDYGPICKHVAATLYAIADEWDDRNQSPVSPFVEILAPTRKKPLAQIIDQLDIAEMRKLLTYFAQRQEEIRAYLLSNYSNTLETVSKSQYVQLVRAMIDSFDGDRYGFLEYRQADRLGDKLSDLLDNAQEKQSWGLIYLCEAIIEQLAETLNHADDSSGSLGGAMSSAFYTLNGLVEPDNNTPSDLVRHIFEYALMESQKEKYSGWDWAGDLRSIAVDATRNQEEAQQVIAVLEKYIAKNKDSKYGQYSIEVAERLKYTLLMNFFSAAQAETFLQQNLEYTSFRVKALEQAMQEKRYDEVRQLIEEGIQLDTERRHPGTVDQWKKWLIQLAEATGDKKILIQTNEELFLDRGDMNYYHELKKIVPAAEFPKKIEQYIQYFRDQNSHWSDYFNQSVADILQEEKRWQDLLEEVKKGNSLRIVDHYYPIIGDKFKIDFLNIYVQSVQQSMANGTGRGLYQECCSYIDKIVQLGGQEEAKMIVNKWRQEYPRRRAMLEELARYKW